MVTVSVHAQRRRSGPHRSLASVRRDVVAIQQTHLVQLPEERHQALPALAREPHPLGGLCYIDAPTSGIAVYLVQPGDWVEAGQAIVDIVDPISLAKTTVRSPAAGVVFAHSGQRLARPERKLMSISSPVEQGNAGLSP